MKEENRRDVLVSIQPEYASKIIDGSKSVELRRRFPESINRSSRVVIYSTSPIQAVVGYAVIESVRRLSINQLWQQYGGAACIDQTKFDKYFTGLKAGYAILLSEVKRFKHIIPAAILQNKFGFVAPQSFRYISSEYQQLFSNERVQVTHRHEHIHRP
jgi:predicted transcriptional regulator